VEGRRNGGAQTYAHKGGANGAHGHFQLEVVLTQNKQANRQANKITDQERNEWAAASAAAAKENQIIKNVIAQDICNDAGYEEVVQETQPLVLYSYNLS